LPSGILVLHDTNPVVVDSSQLLKDTGSTSKKR